jgi:flagellin-specific chaperone FliS
MTEALTTQSEETRATGLLSRLCELLDISLPSGSFSDQLRFIEKAYDRVDQEAMSRGTWDHRDQDFLLTKVKKILEELSNLLDDESEGKADVSNMLWFYHHHAISSAVFRYSDRRDALQEAQTALRYQVLVPGHPNRITKLFELLLEDRIADAERYIAENIPSEFPPEVHVVDSDGRPTTNRENPEYQTALDLLADYKQTQWGLGPKA